MIEVTRRQLAQITGLSESHIGMLIKRGELPQGRKDGRLRLLPRDECLNVLLNRERWKLEKYWRDKLEELF
jgi:excisionase family DNA binding protein